MADEAQQAEESYEPETETIEKQGGVLRRLWNRVAFAWRWLCRPDKVGQPITLRPRGVRLLILLILGNLVVLVL
ncbi:MAG: hypothetical protein KAX26_08660, partial [Anaerolineae bacterium]|nr:hypothetical protein [Anaerolineae bacterium]